MFNIYRYKSWDIQRYLIFIAYELKIMTGIFVDTYEWLVCTPVCNCTPRCSGARDGSSRADTCACARRRSGRECWSWTCRSATSYRCASSSRCRMPESSDHLINENIEMRWCRQRERGNVQRTGQLINKRNKCYINHKCNMRTSIIGFVASTFFSTWVWDVSPASAACADPPTDAM